MLVAMLLLLALVLATKPFTALAATGDLNEIVNYGITVSPNSDATLSMTYHVEWKVLDSTWEGSLTWVRIGIPNSHCSDIEGLSKTVESIRYDSSGGSYVRIDLDRAYHAGEVVSFDFSLVQDYMYDVESEPAGTATYVFTPRWFDDIRVDNLEVRWSAGDVSNVSPEAEQNDGYYVWRRSLDKGECLTVSVSYPVDALAFDTEKKAESAGRGRIESAIAEVIGWICALMWFGVILAYRVLCASLIHRARKSAYERRAGFTADRQVWRTKVAYYRYCPDCRTARKEGQNTCSKCGRNLVRSEKSVTAEDLPDELRDKAKDGEYAYSGVPDTYLRVRVVPAVVRTTAR